MLVSLVSVISDSLAVQIVLSVLGPLTAIVIVLVAVSRLQKYWITPEILEWQRRMHELPGRDRRAMRWAVLRGKGVNDPRLAPYAVWQAEQTLRHLDGRNARAMRWFWTGFMVVPIALLALATINGPRGNIVVAVFLLITTGLNLFAVSHAHRRNVLRAKENNYRR